ncbi:hypothetical protein ACLOJK_022827 [Asimina triloba]
MLSRSTTSIVSSHVARMRSYVARKEGLKAMTGPVHHGWKPNDSQRDHGVASEELERGQRATLEFLQSYSLKRHSAKGAFFRWCQGLPFPEASSASPREELEGHLHGKASARRRELVHRWSTRICAPLPSSAATAMTAFTDDIERKIGARQCDSDDEATCDPTRPHADKMAAMSITQSILPIASRGHLPHL